jgi:hypothetical protein
MAQVRAGGELPAPLSGSRLPPRLSKKAPNHPASEYFHLTSRNLFFQTGEL